MDFYFDGKAMYNRYNRWHTNETILNLSLTWETPYFQLRVGESLITFHELHFRYTEPLTFTFGTSVNIRPRWNSWNVGIFFRNYDDFYFENWNINWGLNFNASLAKDVKLFGEFNIRPAGSMSQLASRYETSGKLGIYEKATSTHTIHYSLFTIHSPRLLRESEPHRRARIGYGCGGPCEDVEHLLQTAQGRIQGPDC